MRLPPVRHGNGMCTACRLRPCPKSLQQAMFACINCLVATGHLSWGSTTPILEAASFTVSGIPAIVRIMASLLRYATAYASKN